MKLFRVIGLIGFVIIAGCSKNPGEGGPNADWQRGRGVYAANCIACHSSDPSKNGPIGPSVHGSSKELLEALLLRGEYPPNYKPKRQSKAMPSFPFLKSEIPYLAVYLASDSKIQ